MTFSRSTGTIRQRRRSVKKQKILVIVGPTSSGKSALAVELARRFNGEVISADSRQVYRGLDLGTGKITRAEMKGVRHHLLDVASPKKIFTAHDFVAHAERAIADIARRGKLPIIAGGTGFYIDALIGRIALADVVANKHLRATLEKKTPAQLLAMLKRKDPLRAKTIEPHNKRRIIRALEIVAALGHVPKNTDIRCPYLPLWIGIAMSLGTLERKIHARLLARMKQGMVAETHRLHAAGFSYKRMEQLGLEYRALSHLLQGKTTREEMFESLYRDIRRYAKRQLVYWKRNAEIRWFSPDALAQMKTVVQRWRAT